MPNFVSLLIFVLLMAVSGVAMKPSERKLMMMGLAGVELSKPLKEVVNHSSAYFTSSPLDS